MQNLKQLELMEANRRELLDYIHDCLSNDAVTFEIHVNEGDGPRYTLSDSELLEKLREEYPHWLEYPALNSLIDDFKLRLT